MVSRPKKSDGLFKTYSLSRKNNANGGPESGWISVFVSYCNMCVYSSNNYRYITICLDGEGGGITYI